eukprot:865230-Prorocentrum_lima.AAC.1
MLTVHDDDLSAGTDPVARGYEPNGAELELVQAQHFSISTPRGQHDPQNDVVAIGGDGMYP